MLEEIAKSDFRFFLQIACNIGRVCAFKQVLDFTRSE